MSAPKVYTLWYPKVRCLGAVLFESQTEKQEIINAAISENKCIASAMIAMELANKPPIISAVIKIKQTNVTHLSF